MKNWSSAMTARRLRRACQPVLALTTLAMASAAYAQSTPVPVPTGPGGGAPIYVQPAPTVRQTPPSDAPEPSASDAASKPLPTAAAPVEPGKEPRQSPRQLTAFPEMTRGLGNSQALLGQ